MKYLIFLICIAACQKSTTSVPTPVIPATSTLHSFELRWIADNGSCKRSYTYPSGQNLNYMIGKADSAFTAQSSVSYSYPSGSPYKYNHYMDGTCIPANSLDSIEVQIWIDGILKAKKKDQNYVNVNFEF